jgi:hypothetical protein
MPAYHARRVDPISGRDRSSLVDVGGARGIKVEVRLSFRAAVHAYNVMDSDVYGFALQDQTITADIPTEAQRRVEILVEEHPAPLDHRYVRALPCR